ncbi:MAG: DNA polymerase IV [Anaerolineae bacterium]|jgi:DNA polymerase-4
MPDPSRAIIHLDLDAFYAAVEVLEDPALSGKPVLVGGRPGERGVVVAASYPARTYGIRSAMPMSRALALCPQAVIVPPHHKLYGEYSRRVMAILRAAASLVEQMSIDEAYLDLTDQIETWPDAVELARRLQRKVGEEVGLSASLGVATNKLVAKVASDRDKPGGLTVVSPGQEAAFLAPLPVRVLWGVGPVMARKLAALGVTTVGELATLPEEELGRRFGQQGKAMARQARGIDRRRVVAEHEIKSVSQERTFSHDLTDADALEQQLRKMSQRVARQLKRKEVAAGTVAIKLRYADFTTFTRQMTLAVPTDDEEVIFQAAYTLLQRAWQRGRSIRLLGVAARRLSPPPGQLPLL